MSNVTRVSDSCNLFDALSAVILSKKLTSSEKEARKMGSYRWLSNDGFTASKVNADARRQFPSEIRSIDMKAAVSACNPRLIHWKAVHIHNMNVGLREIAIH